MRSQKLRAISMVIAIILSCCGLSEQGMSKEDFHECIEKCGRFKNTEEMFKGNWVCYEIEPWDLEVQSACVVKCKGREPHRHQTTCFAMYCLQGENYTGFCTAPKAGPISKFDCSNINKPDSNIKYYGDACYRF